MQLLGEKERHLPLHTFDGILIEDDTSVLPAQVFKPWERGKESAVRAPEVVSHIQGAGRCQDSFQCLCCCCSVLNTKSLTVALRLVLNNLGRNTIKMQILAHVQQAQCLAENVLKHYPPII